MVVGGILLGFAQQVGAQPLGPSLSPYRRYSGDTLAKGHLKLAFQKQWTAAGPSGLAPVELPLSVSSFRSVGRPVLPGQVAAGVPDLDKAQRRELEGALLELLKGYERLLNEQDAPRLKNNLAGAFNFFFLSSYYALRDGQELSPAQQESMLAQLNTGIAMGLKERRLSDREKQELYEAVVLSGAIILGLYKEGRDKGRLEQMKTAREMAKELLEQMMGLTIDKVRVTGDTVRVDQARG